MRANGSGVFLGKPAPPKPRPQGFGLYLRTQPRMYMSHRGKVYDISDIKTGDGLGTVIAKFLPKLMPVVKKLAKNVLSGLAIGAASEGASQAVKAIAGKRGSGLFLKTGGKKEGMVYDITPIAEEKAGMKYGNRLLSNLFDFNSPLKNILILSAIV